MEPSFSNPYSLAQFYLDSGWVAPLPLTYKRKGFPPKGFTGKQGVYPTREQVESWQKDSRPQNIALRMSDTVIGIDVDNYSDKNGLETLLGKEVMWGDLPKTWVSTSRDPETGSGIRFYRVPANRKWLTALPDIEIIQFTHRYAIVWPSLHEEADRMYRWIKPDGTIAENEIPSLDEDIPDLPDTWVEGLSKEVRTDPREDWRTLEAGAVNSPGDDFCMRGDWIKDIFEPAGWTLTHKDEDGVLYWRRPGKLEGNSLCTGKYKNTELGWELAHCFTSSTEFTVDETYNKFACYAILHHKGDYSSAAKELARRGFGQQEGQAPDLTDYRGGDVENGELFAKEYGRDYKWIIGRKSWGWWNGHHWEVGAGANLRAQAQAKKLASRVLMASFASDTSAADGGQDRMRFLQREANKLRSTNGVKGALEMAKDLQMVHSEAFDDHKHLFNVVNGTLNLDAPTMDRVLQQHRREDLLSVQSPWAYDPDAQCPTWDKFLDRAFQSDQEVIAYVQKMIGYMLSGDTSDKSLFFLHGVTDTGKTQFVEAVRSLLGNDYALTMKDDALLQKFRAGGGGASSEIAALAGKRLATISELPAGARLNINLVKQITGGGKVSARRLYENDFEFEPQAKILIDTNYKPQVLVDDEALWNRIRVVQFKVRIPKGEQDKRLHEKFIQEMSGILAWAVRGWFAYRQEGLQVPEKVEKAVAEYRREEDWFADFLDERCIVDTSVECKAGELFSVYKEWAYSANIKNTLTVQAFGRHLSQRGFENEKRGSSMYRKGIAIRSTVTIGKPTQDSTPTTTESPTPTTPTTVVTFKEPSKYLP